MESFFSKFKFSHRLLWISGLYMVVIFSLGYLYEKALHSQVDFARWELYGNAYQKPAQKLLQGIGEYKIYGIEVANGNTSTKVKKENSEKLMSEALAELTTAQSEYGEYLKFNTQDLESRNKSADLLPDAMKSSWSKILSAGTQKPELITQYISNIRNIIAHLGDQSNLILDPDLDSYYLMDVTLLALPQTQDRLTQIISYGQNVFANGEITLNDRVAFASFASMLEESDLARVIASSETALNEDVNFYGTSETLQSNYPSALSKYKSENQNFLAMVKSLSLGENVTWTREEFVEQGLKAFQASFELWNVAVVELDSLLEIRIRAF